MAVDFDPTGADEYIQVADATVFRGGTDGANDRHLCFAMWAYFDVVNVLQYLWWRRGAIGDEYYFALEATGKLARYHYSGAAGGKWLYHNADVALSAGQWYHIVSDYTGNEDVSGLEYYLNGDTWASTKTEQAGYVAMRHDWANVNQIGKGLNGRLEDVRAYNRSLSVGERHYLASGGREPLGGEVCWLDLALARAADSGTDPLVQGTHTFNDLSGNGNDGDPYQGPAIVASTCPRMGVAI